MKQSNVRERGALSWIKIGILIGIGLMLSPLLLPLGYMTLVASPVLLSVFLIAFSYHKFREWRIRREMIGLSPLRRR